MARHRLSDLMRIGYTGEYDTSASVAGAGAVASFCLDEACRSLVSLAGQAGAGSNDPDEGDTYRISGLLISPSLVVAVGPRIKLVGEVHVAGSTIGGALAFALLRLPFDHFTFEVGTIVGYEEVALFPIGSVGWRF